MRRTQSMGLNVEAKYGPPRVSSVDIDQNSMTIDETREIYRKCRNKRLLPALNSLGEDGWQVQPTSIANYVLLVREVEVEIK